MSEQLSLFTIHPVEISKPVHDPYWDEIASDFTDKAQNDTVDADSLGEELGSSTKHPSSRLGVVSPNLLSKSAHQHTDLKPWNPVDFGDVAHKAEGNQLTIFYDDSTEPPDPDDYPTLADYEQAWREWELLVGEQVNNGTHTGTVHSLVGEQVTTDTKKSAHQHDRQHTQHQTPQKFTHWVEKYWVERSGSKHWYYRYTWMTGRKLNRLYIGSAQSAIAQNRKSEIEIAIADGETPAGIQNLIRSWKS